MYIIKTKDGELVAMMSRLEDTNAYMVGSKESDNYVMTEMTNQSVKAEAEKSD